MVHFVRYRTHRKKNFLQSRLGVAALICLGLSLVMTSSIALIPALSESFQQLPLWHLTSGSTSTSTGSPATPPATITQSYGIAAGGSLTDFDSGGLDQRMAGIAATGASWVRFDFKWSDIQPDNATTYNWASYDQLVAASQKYHLAVLGILDFTPGWARASGCKDSQTCYPANEQQFATFATAVVNRYKNKGLHYWEIWNEPNSPQFWQPSADPAEYKRMLQAAAPAMRTADSKVYIITGGLSPQPNTSTSYSPISFLTNLYKAGAKPYFDAVADHPYTFPLSPKDNADDAWTQMARPTNSLRQIMQSNGDSDKKLWITEFGSPTGGPGAVATISNPNLGAHPYVVDEGLQNKILGDAISLYKTYPWAGPFFYYSYQDAGTTQDTNENFFGLVRYDGSHKPAYDTFKVAAAQ